MPTATGQMDAIDMKRLNQWKKRQADIHLREAIDEWSLEAAGVDYERPVTPLTSADCADHARATLYSFPRPPLQRRKRWLFRRLPWL